MDREQAKKILSAQHPGGDSAEGEVLFEEALACMENDPELAEWFAGQQEGDDAMRDALRTVQPPAHLREAILTAAKVIPMDEPTARRLPLHCLAAAAAVAVAAGLLVFSRGGGTVSTVALERQLVGLTESHEHGFASAAGNLDEIRAWLAARGGPADFVVPAGLANRGAVGCEIAAVEGAQVTVLCFHLGEGRTAHLYVMDRARLAEPPAEGAPDFRQLGGIAVAGWSAGTRSYFLAERGDKDSLRRLL